MGISLGNAIKSIKEDDKWSEKLFIGGLMSIFAGVASYIADSTDFASWVRIIGFVSYLFFAALLCGFTILTAKIQIDSDSKAMAEWSVSNLFLKGLKFIFSYVLYTIVIMIIFTLIAILLTLITSIVLGLIYYLINLVLNLNPQIMNYLVLMIFIIIMSIILTYFMQFINIALVSYYKNHKFRDIMAMKKQFKMVFENQHAAWSLIGKEILYTLLVILILVVLCVTIIGVILIPFVIFTASIIMVNLYAQYAKEIEIGKYID